MYNYQQPWIKRITDILNDLLKDAGSTEVLDYKKVVAENPPQPEMGDIGFPMFAYAKILKKGPPQIAAMVCQALASSTDSTATGTFTADGPYVNIRQDRSTAAPLILKAILENPGFDGKTSFGRPGTLKGKRIMVEYSSPNTNKPLHLGHMRNDILGESISRIFEACGAEVRRVCIINDRGVHICKSMLAYKKYGQGKTPESEGIKSDHFVGDWYVKFSADLNAQCEELAKNKGISKEEAEAQAPLMEEAREMLRLWEAGDEETVELWKKMNSWAFNGWMETYERTGVHFDQYYFESKTYLLGKDEILTGLEKGIFHKEEDVSIQVDLTDEKLDKKVLIRSDGTSIYITQDIGTAILRYNDWSFDRLIFVVGNEQQYHFKVLFTLLDKLGLSWAKNLYHLSYGMVNLPEGKMKSREGTIVDADVLIDSLRDLALKEIRNKDREEAVGDPMEIADKIALGALHYYLLQVSPLKDMVFDPKESLSFTGNTGPYLQYMGARISSLIRKAGDFTGIDPDLSLLTTDAEWELIKILGVYNDVIALAAANIDPSAMAAYLYDVSKAFSRFYHDCPILAAGKSELIAARLSLTQAVFLVLIDAMRLISIPFLEVM